MFIIGPDKKIKLTLTYPASTGRNFLEILRVIDSLQLTANHKVATPANWKPGEDCIISPAIKDAEAQTMFPERFPHRKTLFALHAPAESVNEGFGRKGKEQTRGKIRRRN